MRNNRFSFDTLCNLSGPELDNLITEFRNDLYQIKRKRWEKVSQVLHLQNEIDKELKFLGRERKDLQEGDAVVN